MWKLLPRSWTMPMWTKDVLNETPTLNGRGPKIKKYKCGLSFMWHSHMYSNNESIINVDWHLDWNKWHLERQKTLGLRQKTLGLKQKTLDFHTNDT